MVDCSVSDDRSVESFHEALFVLGVCFKIEFNFTRVAEAGNRTLRDPTVGAGGGGGTSGWDGAGGNGAIGCCNAFNEETNAAFVDSSFARTDMTC